MKENAKAVYQSKRTGEMMVKSTITLPLNIMKRLDAEAAKRGLTRAGLMEKILNKTLPKLPGRPKG